MKKAIVIMSAISCLFMNGQTTDLGKFSTSSKLKVKYQKGTLLEKEVINLSKFKNLNIQKITQKNVLDDSFDTNLGIMVEYETYDRVSKKTITIEKGEISKLIQSLQFLEKKENENTISSQKKYKFETANNIEFGAVYKENAKLWVNYFIFPSEFYSQSITEFSKEELRDLISRLQKAEQEL